MRLFLLLIFAFSVGQAQTISIYFPVNKAQLSPDHQKQLDSIYAVLSDKTSISITGYTDKTGNRDYNKMLAHKRAAAVYDYFLAKGLASSRIELREALSQNNLSNPALQRRTEIALHHPPSKTPLRGVAFQSYKINPDQVTKLEHPSGTKITVPSDIFQYEGGAPAKGPVTIQYREFRTPVEIALSGISMHFQEDSTDHNFLSSGMFEIHFEDEQGNRLTIKPGKNLNIDFILTAYLPETNLYYMRNGHWEFQQRLTSKDSLFYNYRRSRSYVSFEERYENHDYVGVHPLENGKPDQKAMIRVQPISGKPNSKEFIFSMMDDYKEHTEFDSLRFMFYGKGLKYLDKLLARGKFYDARLSSPRMLVLKDSSNTYKIPVKIGSVYIPNDRQYGNDRERYLFNRFMGKLANRQRTADDTLSKQFEPSSVEECLYQLEPFLNKQEKSLLATDAGKRQIVRNHYDWIDSCYTNPPVVHFENSKLSASLLVARDGVYNGDQIYDFKEPAIANVSNYRSTNGDMILAFSGYLIDHSIKGAFSMDTRKYSLKRFAFNEKSNNSILITDTKGKMYYAQNDALQKNLQQQGEMILKEVPEEADTVEKIDKMLK